MELIVFDIAALSVIALFRAINDCWFFSISIEIDVFKKVNFARVTHRYLKIDRTVPIYDCTQNLPTASDNFATENCQQLCIVYLLPCQYVYKSITVILRFTL